MPGTTAMEPKKMGRPKKLDKPTYTTMKVDVRVYGKLKTLALLTNQEVATLGSEILLKGVDPLLNVALKKQFKTSGDV